MTKTCTRCAETKPIEQFSVSRQGVKGPVYRANCKACAASMARKWAKDNPERHAATRWKFEIKQSYGMTPDDWQKLYNAQGGLCAICGIGEESRHGTNGTQFRLSVDHCHDKGHVRGLLCNRCNRAIGLLGDNVELLKRAIQYLSEEGGSN